MYSFAIIPIVKNITVQPATGNAKTSVNMAGLDIKYHEPIFPPILLSAFSARGGELLLKIELSPYFRPTLFLGGLDSWIVSLLVA